MLKYCVDSLVTFIKGNYPTNEQKDAINSVFEKFFNNKYPDKNISDFNDIRLAMAEELYGKDDEKWDMDVVDDILTDIFVHNADTTVTDVDHTHDTEEREGRFLVAEDKDTNEKLYLEISYCYSPNFDIDEYMCDFYPEYSGSFELERKAKIPAIQKFQKIDFKYPDSKSGDIKDRELFVLDYDDTTVSGISLNDNPNKDAILKALDELNKLINNDMSHFRKFKYDKMC